jgi:GGDEF domain-containing protein
MVAQRNETSGCVLFIDLNRFKQVNDTLGRASATSCCARWRALSRRAARGRRGGAPGWRRICVGLFDIRQHFEATTVAQKLQAALDASLS